MHKRKLTIKFNNVELCGFHPSTTTDAFGELALLLGFVTAVDEDGSDGNYKEGHDDTKGTKSPAEVDILVE